MVTSILPLDVEGLELWRQGKRILGPISHRLDSGGITIVLGPNGSGKTSFLRAMHGLERVNKGKLRWSAPLTTARSQQAFVFQSPTLLRRTVAENIAYPLRIEGATSAQARAKAETAAAQVGLGHMLDLPALVLSGGEKQKLALARALVRDPQVLFLDEPCANLDGKATREIEAILEAASARGTKIVMSTHNVGQARRLAADVLFLYRGLLHDSGPSATFFANPPTPEARAHIQGDLLP